MANEFDLSNNMPFCFQAKKFYRNCEDVGERLESQFNELQKHPVPSDFKQRIDGATVVWKVFKKQQDALTYMQNHTKDAKTFAFEVRVPGNEGKRMYLVTHPNHLWQVHKIRPQEERCTYEVIAKGSPCKLYFDLEYSKEVNLTNNGSSMVETFIECICEALKDKYEIGCDKSKVLWLDASTDIKFSCHLIFQLDDVCFLNNEEAGKFVHYICADISKKITDDHPSAAKLKELIIKDKNGRESFFCDQGVYSKNRNFRLYCSTKFKKNAPLVLAAENCYKGDSDESIFLDSLVTYFRSSNNLRMLVFEDEICRKFTNINYDEKVPLTSETFLGSSCSPYPEVDDFIFEIVTHSSKPGYIRRWSYFSEKETLVYDIAGYRYCENIGRHHKSNNIMIVAKLQEGVYYQKCYDPECRLQGFQSKVRRLPPQVLPSYFIQDGDIDMDLFENCLTPEEENQLCEAMLKLESSPEYQRMLTE